MIGEKERRKNIDRVRTMLKLADYYLNHNESMYKVGKRFNVSKGYVQLGVAFKKFLDYLEREGKTDLKEAILKGEVSCLTRAILRASYRNFEAMERECREKMGESVRERISRSVKKWFQNEENKKFWLECCPWYKKKEE